MRNKAKKFGRHFDFLLILPMFFAINVAIILLEWSRRVFLLYGITDESYLYNQIQNAQEGRKYTNLFAQIMKIPFSLVEGSVIAYRFIGLLLLIMLAVCSYYNLQALLRKTESNIKELEVISIFFISILLIPSTFRYLLISPGYQWLIITSVVILLNVVIRSIAKKTWNNYQTSAVSFFCSLLVILNLYTRLTAFIVLTTTILIIYYLILSKRMFIIFFGIMLSLISMYILINAELISSWTLIIKSARATAPKEYSIISEIFDVSSVVILIFFTAYLGKNIFSKKFKDNLFSRNLITLGIFFVVLYCWIVQLKNISSVIICIMCTLLGTYLPGKSAIVQSSKKSISIFILIALPVLSQFGSSTSASSNPNLLLITISLFPVIGILFYETKIKDKNSIFHLVLILIIGFQMISLNNSYETNLNTSEFIQVSGGNLKTSKQTASNIKEFQDGFSSARNLEPIRIIDLSFFHPGGALYLNQSAESLGTLDLFFSYTIDSQLKLIFSSYFSTILKSSTLLLVSTANVEVDRTQGGCQEIREWINRSANQKISNSVYLPKIRYVAVSIYKSSPSETTLYPQNLAILKQC